MQIVEGDSGVDLAEGWTGVHTPAGLGQNLACH